MRLLVDRLNEIEHIKDVAITEKTRTISRRPFILVTLALLPKMSRIKGAAARFGLAVGEKNAGAYLTHRRHPNFSIEQCLPADPSTFSVNLENDVVPDELHGKILGFFRDLAKRKARHLRLMR